MILLDTCALVYWSLDPEKLTPKAQEYIKETDTIIISSISIWEIGIKVKRNKLKIPVQLDEYVTILKRTAQLEIIPVDEKVWVKNLELDWDHSDPADRTIVATAILKECSLITSDTVIADFYPKTIW